jgi:hypothetical protein
MCEVSQFRLCLHESSRKYSSTYELLLTFIGKKCSFLDSEYWGTGKPDLKRDLDAYVLVLSAVLVLAIVLSGILISSQASGMEVGDIEQAIE